MVTVVQGKVCAKNHPDRSSRLATIHQRYRRTDGRTDFLWHRPRPNGRPKIKSHDAPMRLGERYGEIEYRAGEVIQQWRDSSGYVRSFISLTDELFLLSFARDDIKHNYILITSYRIVYVGYT